MELEGRTMTEERYKVAVIGGGLAGLSAARFLRSHYSNFEDVVVFEATFNVGGRVKNIEGLAPWPIEAGAEFLHGSRSSIKEIVDEIGCAQTKRSYPDGYYLGKEDQLLTSAEAAQNPFVQEADGILLNLMNEEVKQPDMSIFDYMQKKHASNRSIELANSFYANDFGCEIYELGLHECIHEAKSWTFGDEYLLLDRPLSSVVEYLAQGLNIQVNSPVYKVEFSSEGRVKIFICNNRQPVVVDYAILTVPLTVLQRQMIEFVPSLPLSKMNAIKAIGMTTALKVVLAFSRRFWPENTFHFLCSDCFFPEVWSTAYPSCTPATKQEQAALPLGRHILVGFVVAAAAAAAAALPPSDIFRRALLQFDAMFKGFHSDTESQQFDGSTDVRNSMSVTRDSHHTRLFTRSELFRDRDPEVGSPHSQPNHPASYYFTGGCIINWGEEPYIYGGYTHPSVGAHGARGALATPVEGRLFFAGEATDTRVNPCMHGAIDSGLRAAQEVVTEDVMGGRNSRL